MDMVVPKNGPFTFNCKAEGNPKPSIHWFKDDHELKTDALSHRMILPTGGLFFLKVKLSIINLNNSPPVVSRRLDTIPVEGHINMILCIVLNNLY